MLTSMTFAPPSTCWRATSTASSYFSSLISRANFLRAGDVRPLADHEEVAVRAAASAAACRSAAATARRVVRSMRLELRALRRRSRAMCSGVVPQQPPTMFTQPRSANSPSMRGHLGGPEVVLPHLVRQAGVGMATDPAPATLAASVSKCGRISSGPSAQFMPTESIGKCAIAFQNASTSCPETNVAPPLSNVPETITGTRHAGLVEVPLDREQARLQIERVDHRFRQQNVDARLDQRRHLLRSTTRPSRRTSRRDSSASSTLRADRRLLRRRADRAGDEPRPVRRALVELVARPAAHRPRPPQLISRTSSSGSSNSSMPTGLAPNVFVSTMSAPAAR